VPEERGYYLKCSNAHRCRAKWQTEGVSSADFARPPSIAHRDTRANAAQLRETLTRRHGTNLARPCRSDRLISANSQTGSDDAIT
jgi:hypothetical protein